MANPDFDFNKMEDKWRSFWEKEKIYSFDYKSKKKIYSVDTPPPTVSGKMHMGHAGSFAQQDFFIRYKRMKGFNIFYPFGTDDNGLATERLIEKTQGIKAGNMERGEFVNLCMKLLREKFQPEYFEDWKRIAISCDWNLLYSTIDDHCRRTAQWSFLDLFKKNRIYRKNAPTMWCPECSTGISQTECEDKILDSLFSTIIFKVDGKDLKIDTTRPELLPASVAVFYHPDDKRYTHLKGKKAKVPLFNLEVPIIEDKRAEMDKGTGIAYCATFGDQTDMEWQKAHNLPILEAIDKNGRMTSIAGKYCGMSIREAREEIIKDLEEAGLLISKKPVTHSVNVHERCGTEIEFIKSPQWFVRYLDLKQEMIEWGKELKWYPEFMVHRYNNWVKGLQWDWCISRQRFFGVPFPIWYCKNCEEVIFAREEDLPVDPLKDKPFIKECPKCKCKEFIPEKDVLDTWFTSSLTPLIATNLVEDVSLRKKIFPMSLRPQSHDIISFWLFNTLVKSNLHFGKNAWKETVISGFVLDSKGQKMSKSKGNVVEPREVIRQYGADVLRYWAANSKLGEDIRYQEKDLVTGKKFVNKLINASKFVFSNLEDYDYKKPKKLEKMDEIFLSKMNELIKSATESFDNYEYSKVKLDVESFFWKNFCDNYLEIVKNRIYNSSGDKKKSAQYALYQTLLSIIKMFAPITPFITEELYQTYFRKTEKEKSIHISSWPKGFPSEKEDVLFDLMVEIISNVRQEKSKEKKALNAEISLSIPKKDKEKLAELMEDLKSVTKASEIYEGDFKVQFK